MAPRPRIRDLASTLLLVLTVLSPTIIQGRAAAPAPPLPALVGTVVNVATEAQLQTAVQQLVSNTTIVLAPGTYQLTNTLSISGAFANVAIRGGTDRPDDVVLVGPGTANDPSGSVLIGISTGGGVHGVEIANLTIRDLAYPIVFKNGTQSPHVYNVHIIDAGHQFIRSNPDGLADGVDNGIVEYSVMEYTTTAASPDTGGVEVQGGAHWMIRHNLFRNIVAPPGDLAGPALLMWNGSSDTLTEGNTFLNCARGIAYGVVDKGNAFDHRGGIIRNNFIYRSGAQSGETAIGVADSPNTEVLNNTVYLSGTYATPIEYRFSGTTNVLLANNLLDGFLWARDGATGTELNNLNDATDSMFANPSSGDLHLAGSVTSAIKHGVALEHVTDDWDGQARTAGGAQDVGADEYQDVVTVSARKDTSTEDAATTSARLAAVNGPVAAAAPASASIWSASATPSRIETTDRAAVEIGVRFRADTNGTITGIRFYKGTGNTGTHLGHLWTNAGGLLATATFTSETASGWQQVLLATPVAVTANTTYVASYHANVGQYAVNNSFFATTGVDNAPLHALASGAGGANGVYKYGGNAFPTETYQASNYWVDVVFVASGGDTVAPVVTMTAPATGATVSGNTVTISATATDAVGVLGVQFKLDGANLGAEDTTSPFSLTWDTTTIANGSHTVAAVARDAAGNLATAAASTVTVSNSSDTTAPTVAMTAPSAGATVSGNAVVLSATATDGVGVVGLQFKLDGASVGAEDMASPYTLVWDSTSTANGTHTVTAVARDAAGNIATAASTTVTVSNSDTTAPAVTLTAPASGATVSGSAVAVTASATDSVGVVGVQFKLDGANLGAEETAGPYSFSWNSTTTANGTHTLTAVGRDAAGNSTTSAARTVTVSNGDTTAPIVTMSAPAIGATVSGTAVTVTATATDNIGIVGVQFKLDGANLNAEEDTLPYSIAWDTTMTAGGTHTLTALARDAAGNTTLSVGVTVTVTNADTTAPVVAMTAPAAAATVSGSAVTVSATATDNVGVVGVQFRLDGVNLGGEDTVSPYSVAWNTTSAANGTHTVTAVARDAAGNTTTAATRTVTVNNSDVTAPTVSMTAPSAGATVSGSAVTVSATATDSVGVAGVQFKLDGANLGAEDTVSPYGVAWNTTTAVNGIHTVTAVARDAAGNMTTTAATTVTVNNSDITAPTVSMTAPANGATVAGGAVTLTATASDTVGVAGVQFKLDGANLGAEDTSSPYALTWDTTTTANGTHTLTAVARDAAGNTATAAASTVTVNNVAGPLPASVVFHASTDNATVVSYFLEVFANGSNPNTATAVASSDLAKPGVDANGDITVDRSTFFNALAAGTYLVTVSSIGPGGPGRSVAVTFIR